MWIFRRLVETSAKGLAAIAAVCLCLMMVQIVADVVLKFVFNAPIEGNLEIVSFYYMVGVVFLPMAMVEVRHEHINVDLFVMKLPGALQRALYILTSLTTAGFFALLAYQTVIDAVNATRVGEVMMGTNLVPIWPSRWALPAGFTAIGLACILHACRTFTEAERFDPTPSSPEISVDPS